MSPSIGIGRGHSRLPFGFSRCFGCLQLLLQLVDVLEHFESLNIRVKLMAHGAFIFIRLCGIGPENSRSLRPKTCQYFKGSQKLTLFFFPFRLQDVLTFPLKKTV